MKIFQKNLMASEDVGSLLGTGVFYADGVKAECPDGALVVIGELADHSIYSGLKDLNTRMITTPTAESTDYAIVDYVGVSEGKIMGNIYREGIQTAGLVAPAGRKVRYRILRKQDTFYLGTDNFDAAPAVGKYAIPEVGVDTWKIVDAKPEEGGLCIKIETTKDLTEGMVDTDTLYFCRVIAE